MKARQWTDNISWISEIPLGWSVTNVGRITRFRDERNTDHCDDLLSLSSYTGVRPKNYDDDNRIRSGEDLEKYWAVRPRQLVVNPMWLNHGSIAVSWIPGVISPDYRIYDLRDDALPEYAHHVFRSSVYLSLYEVLTRGHTTYDRRISKDDFASLPFTIPSLHEQRAIADYLDSKTAAIDALIEKKERLISLLAEKRDALIHEAMQLPETRKFRLGTIASRVYRPIERRDEDIYRPIGLYNRGRGIFHKELTAGADLGDSDFFWIKRGDLILSGQFAWEGAIAQAGEEETGCVATHRYPILRGKPGLVETAYLLAFFRTRTGDFLLNEHSRGAAGRNRPLRRR